MARWATVSALRELVEPLVRDRRLFLPLAGVLLVTYGYFVTAPAWNQNSRLALTRALVETRSTIIDPWHETTGDKSFRDGHFYSDKAPGTSMLATVPYAIFWAGRAASGTEPPTVRVRPLDPRDEIAGRTIEPGERKPGDLLVYNAAHRLALWVCSLFTVGLATVAAAGGIYLVALRQSRGRRAPALVAALAWALATPAFPYATVLYGHQLCASLLAIAFAIAVLVDPRAQGRAAPLWIGALLATAVATEYTAIVPAALIGVLALARLGRRSVAPLVLGGLPAVVALLTYHHAAFGSPWKTGYDFVWRDEFAEGMAVRYGFGTPDPEVALALLFGSYRGLFYVAPVLLLAVWGLGRAFVERSEPGRAAIAIAIATPLWFLALNASYYMWDGGASMGPRHMVPALPFLALGVVPAVAAVPRAFAVLVALSGLQMLLGAGATPEAPQHGDPIWEYALGRVLDREVGEGAATNLGLLLGLPGVWSLVPLAMVWGAVVPMLRDVGRAERRAADPPRLPNSA